MANRDSTASLARVAAAAAAGACMAFGVFLLPYRFPPSSPILSASLLAGFNNGVAYVAYVLSLAILAVLVAAWTPARIPLFSGAEPGAPLFRKPGGIVVAVMAAHVVLFVALYLWKHGFVFAEALYFQETAYRVMAGTRPFVDFNFFYGPALVYPTAFLARLLGLPAAYAAYYIACYSAGLYLLFVLLTALIEDARVAAAAFVVFALGFFNPITGLNYTFARFLLPPVALLASWRCAQRFSAGRAAAGAGLIACALLCSPDIGVVTLVGLGAAAAWSVAAAALDRRSIAQPAFAWGIVLLGGLVLAAALLLCIDGSFGPARAYLKPIATFSAGAWNTPIDPSLPMLTLLALSVIAAAMLWNVWRLQRHAPAAALAVGYAAIIVLMDRAIFGKADVEHIAFSGLPAFCLVSGWGTAAPAGSRRGGWIAAAVIVGVMAPLQFYHSMLFLPSVAQRLVPQVSAQSTTAPARPASKEAVQASLSRAVEHFGPDRAYYMHKLEYYRLPIFLRYHLRPELYHPSLTSAFTERDIEGVIANLTRDDAIVLARRADLEDTVPVPTPLRWWNYATSSPVQGSAVFNLTLEFQARLERPLVRFLKTSYEPGFEDGEIVGLVMRRDARALHAVQ